jgi:hypothetical protein
MATLTGNTIASTYTGLLSVSGAVGADTVEAVTDGAGTSTSLSLSQQRATITLGSGAADDFIVDGTTLVVEGDNNRVGIGTAAPANIVHVVSGGDGILVASAGAGLILDRYADATYASDIYSRKARGSKGSEEAIHDDDLCLKILGQGWDLDTGGAFVNCVSIEGYVDGAVGNDDMPGRLVFKTSPDGSATLAERMRIDSSGSVGIGNSTLETGHANHTMMQVGALGVINAETSENTGQILGLFQNYFINASGAKEYIYNDEASGIEIGNAGTIKLLVSNAVGSDGGTFTPLAAVTVENDGDVTIAGDVNVTPASDHSNLTLTSPATDKATNLILSNPASSAGGSGNSIQFKEGDGSGSANNSFFRFHHSPHSNIFVLEANGSTVWSVDEGSQDTTFTGDLIMADGKGIDFSADASPAAGMTSEILDDYEEGYYDAVFTCGTSGTITAHTGFDDVAYTKIGRVVHIQSYVDVSAVSSPVGSLRVSLPFTATDLTSQADHAIGTVQLINADLTDATSHGLFIHVSGAGSTYAMIKYNKDASSPINDLAGSIGAGNAISFSITYFVE